MRPIPPSSRNHRTHRPPPAPRAPRARRRRARGHAHLGAPRHAGRAWLDPSDTEAFINPFMVLYAIHDALVKPMPGGRQHAEPGRVVDGVEGRAHLRVRPAQGREVPQRRPGDRGGREVLVRPLQGRRGQAPQGPGARGPDRRSRPRALHPEGAVAGLHDLLRHLRHRRGVDRAEEVRGEGGRGRLQEGADRRRARTRS